MVLPLSGIKVVELTANVAGPYAGVMLADFGAEVVKVERPEVEPNRDLGPEWRGAIFVSYNRSKKSLAIDLESESGKDLMLKLLKGSDVFIENLEPGFVEGLGFSYDVVAKINPKIIYVSIKGYLEGPYGNRPAHGAIIEAESSLMYTTGEIREGAPPCRPAGPIIDCSTGIFTVIAIMGALMNREKTGKGDKIVSGIFESAVSLVQSSVSGYSLDKRVAGKWGSRAGGGALAFGMCFKSKDGWVYADAPSDKYWSILCDALEISDEDKQRFPSTEAMRKEKKDPQPVLNLIASAISKFTTAEAAKRIFEKKGVGAPVNTMKEIADDPQLKDTKSFVPLTPDQKVTLTPNRKAVPYIMLPTRTKEYNPNMMGWGGTPAPKLGEHTVEIIRGLGYTDEQITDLRKRKIIWPYT